MTRAIMLKNIQESKSPLNRVNLDAEHASQQRQQNLAAGALESCRRVFEEKYQKDLRIVEDARERESREAADKQKIHELQTQLESCIYPLNDSRYWVYVIRGNPELMIRIKVTDSEGTVREFRGYREKSSFRIDQNGCGFKVDDTGIFSGFFPYGNKTSYFDVLESKWASGNTQEMWNSGATSQILVHRIVSTFWPVINTSGRPVDNNSQLDHTCSDRNDNSSSMLQWTGGVSDNRHKKRNGFRNHDNTYSLEPLCHNNDTEVYTPDCRTLFPLKDVPWGKEMKLEENFPF
jgi:hypothetical protein